MKKKPNFHFCSLLVFLAFASVNAENPIKPLVALSRANKSPQVEVLEPNIVVAQQRLFLAGVSYGGKPTKIFAIRGIPKSDTPVPGIVLIHGGGGTAFREWVRQWNERGFAAISIAVEGQTDELAKEEEDSVGRWKRHSHPGPARQGIFGDSDRPVADQWMFHAVAAGIQAHNLLRNDQRIDSEAIGVMGVSWGGIITSTLIGIDDRFCFAIPTYGCGSLAQAPNQYGRALAGHTVYQEIWDASLRMTSVKIPTFWYSWTGDTHFPMAQFADTYRRTTGPRQISLIPDMGHSHEAAWRRPESYDFARSVVESGQPWGWQKSLTRSGDSYEITFVVSRAPVGATLHFTKEDGHSAKADWMSDSIGFSHHGDLVTVTVSPDRSAAAWFVNLDFGGRFLSSEYVTP